MDDEVTYVRLQLLHYITGHFSRIIFFFWKVGIISCCINDYSHQMQQALHSLIDLTEWSFIFFSKRLIHWGARAQSVIHLTPSSILMLRMFQNNKKKEEKQIFSFEKCPTWMFSVVANFFGGENNKNEFLFLFFEEKKIWHVNIFLHTSILYWYGEQILTESVFFVPIPIPHCLELNTFSISDISFWSNMTKKNAVCLA